jgi:hypothetical protein
MNNPTIADSKYLTAEFGARLVTLCDGRPGLRRGLQAEILEPQQADGPDGSGGVAPVLDFIASSEAVDRYDEILTADGWQLENYRRNPVFQNAHQYGDILFTLGKALTTEVRSIAGRQVLFQRVEFATDINPIARIAYGLYRGKFLNAVSVGFIPLRWENGGAEAGYRRKYLEQELIEVSAVGIPANPEALQLGLRAGAIEKSDLRAWVEMLGQFPSVADPSAARQSILDSQSLSGGNQAAPNPHAGASGVRSNEAQWLQLAREIQRVMRDA